MDNQAIAYRSLWADSLSPFEVFELSSKGVGYTTQEHIWDSLWLFGIVVDGDTKLGSYWNPTGDSIYPDYYVPDDEDTEIPLVSIDSPPTQAVAWDARPL